MQTNNAVAAYQIPNYRLDELTAKVERLARRCVKLGIAPIVATPVHTDTRIAKRYSALHGLTRTYKLDCTWVELSGASPVCAGYEFVARIEHTKAGNLIARVSTDETIDLVPFRTVANNCDHCNADRKRRDTFVLRAPDGSFVQIGRNCLADFLRTGEIETVVSILELVDEWRQSTGGGEGDGEGCGGHYREEIPVSHFLACAVKAVREIGWVSRKAAEITGNEPTSSVAMWAAGAPPHDAKSYRAWQTMQPGDLDVARSTSILEWIAQSTDASDYAYNLRTACAVEFVTSRTGGIIASAVSAYAREVEKVEAAKRSGRPIVGHYGTVGDKIAIEACSVSFVRAIEGSYGVTTIVGLLSPEGHTFKWFASGSQTFVVGEVYNLRGTVKAHTEYKGRLETRLTRCTLTADRDEPSEAAQKLASKKALKKDAKAFRVQSNVWFCRAV